MNSPSTVAVIGGGIAGLVCALRLAMTGARVTLLEASSQLGGLGTFFEHDGRTFEKFYHCALPTDGPLLRLLDQLGLGDQLYWKPTTFAHCSEGHLYPLNSAADLLRFRPLPFLDRLRVGFTGVWGRLVSSKGLDDITAVDWLGRLSGKRAFGTFWKPLLQAKFGDRYHGVPALWFWSRFNREKGDSKGEMKGYIRGGYRRVIDAFRQEFVRLGVTVRLDTPVETLDLAPNGSPSVTIRGAVESYDRVVNTTPLPVFNRITGADLRAAMPDIGPGPDYQGVVNMVLFLKRRLTPHYWVATPDSEFPFDGVVETSTLTDESDRGAGRHVVYLTKYMHRTDARFSEDDKSLMQSWLPALHRIFPHLSPEDIEACNIFRAPFVEPLYTTGFSAARPPAELVPGRVYLAGTAQVYPDVTSWNGAVRQAEQTLEAMKVAAHGAWRPSSRTAAIALPAAPEPAAA